MRHPARGYPQGLRGGESPIVLASEVETDLDVEIGTMDLVRADQDVIQPRPRPRPRPLSHPTTVPYILSHPSSLRRSLHRSVLLLRIPSPPLRSLPHPFVLSYLLT
jgi:hypothetical protein